MTFREKYFRLLKLKLRVVRISIQTFIRFCKEKKM
jgi:hypothetical protein